MGKIYPEGIKRRAAILYRQDDDPTRDLGEQGSAGLGGSADVRDGVLGGDPIVEVVTAAPAAPLRDVVDGYRGYRIDGFPPGGVHLGLPSRHMTFIVSIGDPIEVLAQTDPRQPPDSYRSVLGGLQAGPAMLADPGHQEGIEVKLTPLGARVLLGVPARDLWNTSVELGDVAGPSALELWERLQMATTWRDRFAVCDDVLGRLAPGRQPSRHIERAWRTLVDSAGTVPIGELASAVGYSRQHLSRQFRDELGLAPKLAARVIRFERAHHMLMTTPSFVTIGQVAAACGYADHAHLVREFQSLAGCTPTELAEGQAPFVHDDPAVT